MFTVLMILAGVWGYSLTFLWANQTADEVLVRESEKYSRTVGRGIICLGSLALPLAAFWTPLTWPGPAGEWGRDLASAMGLG